MKVGGTTPQKINGTIKVKVCCPNCGKQTPCIFPRGNKWACIHCLKKM